MRDILIKILGEDGFSKSGTKVGKALEQLTIKSQTLKKALKILGTSFLVVATAASAVATGGLAAVINTGAQFEQKMANVASVTGATGQALTDMSRKAAEMAATTVFSGTQAADALYALGSAGYDSEQSMSALRGTLELAGATNSDLAYTAQTVVSTLSQFAMEADEAGTVSNVFAAAIKNSQLNMERLAEGMKYIGPVAHAVGMSLEETTAALGLLNNAGFMGEMAGTALRGALTALMNPTSALTGVLEKYNLSLDSVNPSTHRFSEILDVLKNAGMSAGDTMQMFGQRAGPAMVQMISQGGAALQEMTDKITGTNDATQMLDQQTDTVIGRWKMFKSALEGTALAIYEWLAPALKVIIDGMTTLVQHIRSKLIDWTTAWEEAHGSLNEIVKEYWTNKIQPFIEDAMWWIDRIWTEVVSPALKGDWKTAWDNLYEIVIDIFAGLITHFKKWAQEDFGPLALEIFSNVGKSMAKSFWEAYLALWKEGWDRFKGWFKYGSDYTGDSWEYYSSRHRNGNGSSGSGGSSWSSDLPGGHDGGHFSGTQKSGSRNTTITINLPPGSSREQATAMRIAAERMMQLGGYD